jgi:hypothetical protein
VAFVLDGSVGDESVVFDENQLYQLVDDLVVDSGGSGVFVGTSSGVFVGTGSVALTPFVSSLTSDALSGPPPFQCTFVLRRFTVLHLAKRREDFGGIII